MITIRFVSHSAGFTVEVVKEKTHFSNYGDRIVDQEQLNARFNQDDVTDEDIAFAEATWGSMPGRTTLVDEITPTPALDRVSVYDTDEEAIRGNWAGRMVRDNRGVEHDLKSWVEKVLLDRAERHPDFRQLVERPVEPPWPTYLQFGGTLDQLIQTLVYQGHDLGKTLRYERQIGRTEVANAIEAEINRQAAELADSETVPA